MVADLHASPTESIHGARHDKLDILSYGKAASVDLHLRQILLTVRVPGPRCEDRVRHFDTWIKRPAASILAKSSG